MGSSNGVFTWEANLLDSRDTLPAPLTPLLAVLIAAETAVTIAGCCKPVASENSNIPCLTCLTHRALFHLWSVPLAIAL